MRYLDQSIENCSVQRTMDVVGEKWTFLILRDVFNGVYRFDDLRDHTGAPRPVLAKRLSTLVEEGLLQRVPYHEDGSRTRHEYRLTRKGDALYPVLVALRDWGDRYVADVVGPARIVEHKGCGALVHAVLTCEAGHRIQAAAEVESRTGPAARLRAT